MSFRNIVYLVAITAFLVSGCKSDGTQHTEESMETIQNTEDHNGHDHSGHNHDHDQTSNAAESANTKPKAGVFNSVDVSIKGIPNPCKLLSAEFIKENTFLKPENVRIKSGTSRGDADHRACFFQWDYNDDPNAGFLVNIAVNPIPEEITDYATVFMRAKKADGETDMGSDKAYPYKHIDNLGVEAMGCKELKKYYFRQDHETLFMIAYNLPLDKKQMDKLTLTIGNEVLRNYNATMN